MKAPTPLKELALLFLKLGITGFGGPAVHIAMMEEEVVRKKGWISRQHFLDLVGATHLIPGPNSTEMTMHCGRERAGWKGLIVAGCCFILPAALLTGLIAWAYRRWGALPRVEPYTYGIKPAIIALIAAATLHLGKTAVKSTATGLLTLLAFVAILAGVHEILVFFAVGLAGAFLLLRKEQEKTWGIFLLPLLQTAPIQRLSTATLFWTFLKIGSLLYGSGYVLFAFLDAELVSRGLLNRQELIDAIAVGQFTPGPVFSAATFIGYQIGGLGGAIAATIGIFLPSFVFVALLNPLLPRLRRSPWMSAFLDSVNAVSVGVIAAVAVEMARITLLDWRTILIALAGFAVTFWLKLNSVWLVISGSLMGYLLLQIG